MRKLIVILFLIIAVSCKSQNKTCDYKCFAMNVVKAIKSKEIKVFQKYYVQKSELLDLSKNTKNPELRNQLLSIFENSEGHNDSELLELINRFDLYNIKPIDNFKIIKIENETRLFKKLNIVMGNIIVHYNINGSKQKISMQSVKLRDSSWRLLDAIKESR